MKIRTFVVITIAVTLFSSTGFSGQGSAGAQFLRINAGIHGTALGGAYSLGEASSQMIFWNPAGIRPVQGIAVAFGHADYFAGIRLENFSLAIPTANGTIGLSGLGMFSGDILRTTAFDPDGLSGDTWSATDIAMGITYARSMTNKFDAGVTLKFISQTLDLVKAFGWAFDLGAVYRTGLLGNLRIAFTLKNFGPDMQYSGEGLEGFIGISMNPFEEEDVKIQVMSEQYALPMSFSLGIASDITLPGGSVMVLHMDAGNSVDQKETVLLGLEWKIPKFIYLAGGHGNVNTLFNPNAPDESLGGNMKSWALGGGINFGRFYGNEMWVEYSWEEHKYLPAVHRYGVEISF